jgi:DNA mismatch repair protein MutL
MQRAQTNLFTLPPAYKGASYITSAYHAPPSDYDASDFRDAEYGTHPDAIHAVPEASPKPQDTSFTTVGGVHYVTVPYSVVGEVFDAYIVVERADSVLFIDKHAAHERVYFDALKSEKREPMSQPLLTPLVSRHGREEMTLLLDNAELLDDLGFTVEAFGEDAIAIRRIPSEIGIDDAESVLSDICAEFQFGSAGTTEKLENIYRSIACKAAIKAGKASTTPELEVLAARVMSGEITHCPHGRPVVYAMPKATLDREFKRT